MQDVKVYSLSGEGQAQISPHFKVREFACRDGSDPVFVAPRLVEVLEAVRAQLPILSARRTDLYEVRER